MPPKRCKPEILSQGTSTKKVKTAQNTLTLVICEWERLLSAQPED